jgi:hypothetical protein
LFRLLLLLELNVLKCVVCVIFSDVGQELLLETCRQLIADVARRFLAEKALVHASILLGLSFYLLAFYRAFLLLLD